MSEVQHICMLLLLANIPFNTRAETDTETLAVNLVTRMIAEVVRVFCNHNAKKRNASSFIFEMAFLMRTHLSKSCVPT